jgi:hypothetical protein
MHQNHGWPTPHALAELLNALGQQQYDVAHEG